MSAHNTCRTTRPITFLTSFLGYLLGSRLIPRDIFEDEDGIDELTSTLLSIVSAKVVEKAAGFLVGGQITRNGGMYNHLQFIDVRVGPYRAV